MPRARLPSRVLSLKVRVKLNVRSVLTMLALVLTVLLVLSILSRFNIVQVIPLQLCDVLLYIVLLVVCSLLVYMLCFFEKFEQTRKKVDSIEKLVVMFQEVSNRVSEIEGCVSALSQEFEKISTMLSEILSRIESMRAHITSTMSSGKSSQPAREVFQVSSRDLGDLVKMLLEVKEALDRVYDVVRRYVSVVYKRRSASSS